MHILGLIVVAILGLNIRQPQLIRQYFEACSTIGCEFVRGKKGMLKRQEMEDKNYRNVGRIFRIMINFLAVGCGAIYLLPSLLNTQPIVLHKYLKYQWKFLES